MVNSTESSSGTNPFLSILLTSFNREKYIEEAIKSILQSTYENFELIIVDDCSVDETYTIALKLSQKDHRIKVYRNERNLGQFQNRNKAAELAKGEYIKYVDSDDTISENALSLMVSAMESSKACIGLVCDQLDIFGHPSSSFISLKPEKAYLFHYFECGILFPGPTGCIYRRNTFLQMGAFPLDLGINADVYLNLKLAAISDVVLFPGNIVTWRRHDEQVDVQQKDFYRMHTERFLINRRILGESNPFSQKKYLRIAKLSCKVLFIRGAIRKVLLKGRIVNFRKLLREVNFSLKDILLVVVPLRLINPLKRLSEKEVLTIK